MSRRILCWKILSINHTVDDLSPVMKSAKQVSPGSAKHSGASARPPDVNSMFQLEVQVLSAGCHIATGRRCTPVQKSILGPSDAIASDKEKPTMSFAIHRGEVLCLLDGQDLLTPHALDFNRWVPNQRPISEARRAMMSSTVVCLLTIHHCLHWTLPALDMGLCHDLIMGLLFITTEFGEALVRRRRAAALTKVVVEAEVVEAGVVRAVVAPTLFALKDAHKRAGHGDPTTVGQCFGPKSGQKASKTRGDLGC